MTYDQAMELAGWIESDMYGAGYRRLSLRDWTYLVPEPRDEWSIRFHDWPAVMVRTWSDWDEIGPAVGQTAPRR